MPHLVVLSLCASLFLLPGCKVSGKDRVVGSGKVITEKRVVQAFEAVELSGGFRVDISVGDAPSLTITTDDNILPFIETNVEDGELSVRITKKVRPSDANDLKITTPSLTKFTCRGAAKATIKGVTGTSFVVQVEGTGAMNATGSVDTLTLDVDGTGHIDALELEAKSVHVTLNGTGTVDVFAVEKLNVDLNGVGAVRYKGDPQVTQRIAGIGTVKKR